MEALTGRLALNHDGRDSCGVKPAARKYAARRFDAHHGSPGTTVLDRRSTLKAGLDPVIDVPLTANVGGRHTVMRELNDCFNSNLLFVRHTSQVQENWLVVFEKAVAVSMVIPGRQIYAEIVNSFLQPSE